jgi:hypothetical protein
MYFVKGWIASTELNRRKDNPMTNTDTNLIRNALLALQTQGSHYLSDLSADALTALDRLTAQHADNMRLADAAWTDNQNALRAMKEQIRADDALIRAQRATIDSLLSRGGVKHFETWAKKHGMLIDLDENSQYKSLETRAYWDTWQAAQR